MIKMIPIESHKHDSVYCYFIDHHKAISFDYFTQEIFYWDVSDIENWNKIFYV